MIAVISSSLNGFGGPRSSDPDPPRFPYETKPTRTVRKSINTVEMTQTAYEKGQTKSL